jgi:outer membrane receptor protein involved in Fe transport
MSSRTSSRFNVARAAVTGLAASAMLAVSPAQAQSTAGGTEEIIVTARKRDESIMKTPVVMAAISEKKIQDLHISSVQGIATATPNLQINMGFALSGITANFRGLGNGGSANFIDQSMALNIDGFTSNSGRLYRQGAFDMAQIEVMKGPQALFYGKSTSSGLIAIHSADPTSTWDSKVGIGYEFEADEMDLDAYVSGPITDKLGIRIAGYHNTVKGWFTNPNPNVAHRRVVGSDDNGGRLTLKYNDPDTGFRAKLKVSFTDYSSTSWSSSTNQQICPQAGVGNTTIPFYNLYAPCKLSHFTQGTPDGAPYRPDLVFGNADTPENNAAFAVGSPYPGAGDGTPFSYTKTALAVLSLDYDIQPDLTLSSVTAYSGDKAADSGYNGTLGVVRTDLHGRTKETEFSQEVRITSNYKDRWYNFMLGGLYNPTTVKNELFFVFPSLRRYTDDKTTLKTETTGAFGQVLLTPIDKWELSAGIRYTHIRKHFVYMFACGNTGLACRDYLPDLLKPQIDFSEDAWTPEFTLTYRPTDDLTAFVTFKHGYKGPGFNANLIVPAYMPTMTAADLSPFGGEKVKGVEGGVKAELLDRQLALTLTGYRYNYKGLQVAFTDIVRNVVYISPAADARVQGIELGADYAPESVPGLTLNAFVNYNDSHYTSFPTSRCYGNQTVAQGCVGGVQDASGRPLHLAAKWTGNAGGAYRWDVNDNYWASFSASVKFSSGYYTSAELNPIGYFDGYALVDLALRFGPQSGKWELGLICRDCNDKLYPVFGVDSGANSSPPLNGVVQTAGVTAQVARPREIMLQLTVHPWGDSD